MVRLKNENNPPFLLPLLWGVRRDPRLKAAYVAALLNRLVAIIFTYASDLGCRWYVQTSDSALALIKTMSVVNCLLHQLHLKLIRRLAFCHTALDTRASYKDSN